MANEEQITETLNDLDDNLSQVNRDHTANTTDISGDVDTQEIIRSNNAFIENQQNANTLAETQQRLTAQAQMNSNFALLQTSAIAAMGQAIQNMTAAAQASQAQTQRCVDHSEEAQHKTIQATIPLATKTAADH
jgi:hypothetical protein